MHTAKTDENKLTGVNVLVLESAENETGDERWLLPLLYPQTDCFRESVLYIVNPFT